MSVDPKFHFKVASALSHLLDKRFGIGSFKFGLDPILGLIPVYGDFVSFTISIYTLWIGLKMNVPKKIIRKMLGNIVFDLLLGVIPIIGDISDFFYHANIKNLELLRPYSTLNIEDAEIVG